MLYHLPRLKFLDSTKVNIVEIKEAEKRGQLMKIVRPKESNVLNSNESPNAKSFTPLPRTIRSPDDHKGNKKFNRFDKIL